MAAKLFIKQFDLQPYYFFHIRDKKTGADIDLTGSTIYVTVVKDLDGSIVINRDTTGIKYTAAGDNILKGKGHYEWLSGFSNLVGVYNIEFEVNPGSGGKFTLPVMVKAQIEIKPGLDSI